MATEDAPIMLPEYGGPIPPDLTVGQALVEAYPSYNPPLGEKVSAGLAVTPAVHPEAVTEVVTLKALNFEAIHKETSPTARLQALQSEVYKFTPAEFMKLGVDQVAQVTKTLTESLPQTMQQVENFDHALAVLRGAPREQYAQTQQSTNDLLFLLTERQLHAWHNGESNVMPADQLVGILSHLKQSADAGQLAEIPGAVPQGHEPRFQKVVGMLRALGQEGKLPPELQISATGTKPPEATPVTSPVAEAEKDQPNPELTKKIDDLQHSLDTAIKGGQRQVEVTVDGKPIKLSQEGAIYLKTILETKGRRAGFEKLVSLVKQHKSGEVIDSADSADPLVVEVIKHLKELDPDLEIDQEAIQQKIREALKSRKKMTTEGIISSVMGMFRQLDPVMTAIQSMAGKS